MVSPFVKAYVYIDAWKCKRKIDGLSEILIKELSSFDYWKGKIRFFGSGQLVFMCQMHRLL